MRMQLQESERQLQQKKKDEALAQMLHDSITGDLSLIMLAASGPEQTDKDKDLILSLSQEALRKTHAVIELLEENRHQTETPALCHGSDIRNLCCEKDAQMQQIGHTGEAHVIGDQNIPVNDECMQLIQELYANILRHCRNSTYTFAIKISEEGVSITQTNTCNDELQLQTHGGKRLELHRKTIEGLGERFTAARVEDSWTVSAWIPSSVPTRLAPAE